jgi:ADP-heptose:LPS heptosyltransferase
MKKALLVRFGGLGDLLVALPSIQLVRRRHPDARLTLACREEYGSLLQETGVVDEIVPEDSRLLTPLFSEAAEASTALSGWLGSFDLIMGWTHGRKGHLAKAGIASGARPAEVHFIEADPRSSGQLSRFFFQRTAETIGESGALSIDEWACLPTGRLERAEIINRLTTEEGKRGFVVVHPGSGSESKRWPLSNFLQIIARLGERGFAGALVTGQAEERMEPEIEARVLPRNWIWVRRPRLSTLASLLSKTPLYIGNDSGITHLAAACAADVVALFRRDLVTAWKPLGRVHPQIAASLSEIRLESVWEAIVSRLPNFSADSQNS